MSRQFAQMLDDLREHVVHMTALVQQAVEQAVQAVQKLDVRLAQQCIASDKQIDDAEVQIEQEAIDLLAQHAPAATDLRLITGIIKVNSDFERIADCAVNIAQRVQPLSHQENYSPPQDLMLLGNSVLQNLRDAIKAFNQSDAELARRVLRSDDVVDALYHQIVQDMLTLMGRGGQQANKDFSTILVAKNLERIADHCTNIAEDVVFVSSGRIIRHAHAG